MAYTRFTDVECKNLVCDSTMLNIDADDFLAISNNAAEAASTAPTAAEFKAVVDLVNELKEVHNKLVNQLITGSDT